ADAEECDKVGSHHRVVIRVSTDVLRPLIEEPISRHGEVDEVIVGVRSRGKSLTEGEVEARFQESSEKIKFQLVFAGNTVADTSGRDGPAKLVHRSDTQFVATKDVY